MFTERFFQLVLMMGASMTAGADLPEWFEANRVQAHNEHPIEIAAAAGPEIHAVIRQVGARALTRIVLNRDEGAWWPSAVGETHELARDRDLAAELIADAHARGMHCIGYFRHMSDQYVQTAHPEWVCRHPGGEPVREPRARRAKYPVYVICVNSPYRDYIQQRLIELAHRGIDMVYFDSWHMPEVCTCPYCKARYETETGQPFPYETRSPDAASAGIRDDFESYAPDTPPAPPAAGVHSADPLAVSAFVSRSLVAAFTQWRAAARRVNPEIRFAIGSSLYPVFDRQPHLTDDFLAIADTAKTEFHKPFGGAFDVLAPVEGVAAPTWDLQTALGWMWTRDSSGGRPPLMWIPYIQREKEALYSSAAAVAYGCIASLHVRVYDRRSRAVLQAESLAKVFGTSFERGHRMSRWLARTRPYGWAAIHISETARNRRLDDRDACWRDVFAPVLGVFQALKEAHIPTVTVADRGLDESLPSGPGVLVLPWPGELTEHQRRNVAAFGENGGHVIELKAGVPWFLKEAGEMLRGDLTRRVQETAPAPLTIEAPAAVHANVFRLGDGSRTVVTLVNSWGWYRSQRQVDMNSPTFIDNAREPAPIEGVSIEVNRAWHDGGSVIEAVTGAELPVHVTATGVRVTLPPFQITRCVVFERRNR